MKKERHEQERSLLVDALKREGDLSPAGLKDLDWPFLWDMAARERVFYPFSQRVLEMDAQGGALPFLDRDKFLKKHYLLLSEALRFNAQARDLLGALDSLKLRLLLLKGPSIDACIYGNDFLRPRADIDIAVQGQDRGLFEKLLFARGYISYVPQDYSIFEFANSRIFSKKEADSIPIHLHHHPLNNIYFSDPDRMRMITRALWSQTAPFQTYENIVVLAPEAQLIYLSDHALKHDYDKLVYVYEFDRLWHATRDRLDGQKLIGLAKEWGLDFALYYAFYFARRILATSIDEKYLESLKPARLTYGEKRFIEGVVQRRCPAYGAFAAYLAQHKRAVQKLRFIFRVLFPPQPSFFGYLKRIWRGFKALVLR